jgi:flagellar protein FliO/FliZ
MKRLVVTALAGAMSVGHALAAEPAAESARPGALDNLGSIALGLGAVLVVIFLSAWLVRRLQGLQGPSSNAVKVLAVLPVGQRERIALLEAGKTQLLVGITAHSIRTLHVFEEPVVDADSAAQGDFASRLQAMLAKGSFSQGKGKNKQGDAE